MSTNSYKYRGRLIKECDALVSLIVRNRDRQCVTCVYLGKYPDTIRQPVSALQCGHLLSRRFGGTRFDLTNCNAQCPGCNKSHNFDSVPYTQWFIKKYGQEAWEDLYRKARALKKWRIFELEALKVELTEELKKYESI